MSIFHHSVVLVLCPSPIRRKETALGLDPRSASKEVDEGGMATPYSLVAYPSPDPAYAAPSPTRGKCNFSFLF